MTKLSWGVAATVWLGFLVGMSAVLPGSAGAQGGVKVIFAPPSPSPTLHEPVFFELQIHNGLAEGIAFDLGHNRKSNLQFTITQPDGTVVQPPRLSESGLGRIGRLTLEAGKTYRQRLLLDEWFQFPRPGVYKVKAELVTTVTTASGQVVKTGASGAVSLEILPADPEALSRAGRQLAAAATNPSNAAEAIEASLALSHMRDPAAVPFLKEVLQKGGQAAKLNAASGLGAIGNRDAIETLIAALNTHDPDVRTAVRQVLGSVKETVGNPELKNRIEAALETHQ